MAQTSHKVAGIYPDHASARTAVDALQQAGIGADAIAMVDKDDWQSAFTDPQIITERAKHKVATGAGVGAGLGALGAGALALAEVAVIAAAPVLAMLVGAGLGAAAGTAYTGVSSSSVHEPEFRDVVREAVTQDHVVVIVRTFSEAESLHAQDLIARTSPERSVDQLGGQHAGHYG